MRKLRTGLVTLTLVAVSVPLLQTERASASPISDEWQQVFDRQAELADVSERIKTLVALTSALAPYQSMQSEIRSP